VGIRSTLLAGLAVAVFASGAPAPFATLIGMSGNYSTPVVSRLDVKLWTISQRTAIENDDPRAYERWAVGPVARNRAVKVTSGDAVGGSGPSYVIEIRGTFVCDSCSVPPGGRAPQGHVITLVVAAKTFGVTDFGLTDKWVDLRRLGTPFRLTRSGGK
jgi:hypothetical protein